MSIIEKKQKNLNQLISKLNSLSLTYSQPSFEIEKIRTEKNEILRQKTEIEKKNQDLMREHNFLKKKRTNSVQFRYHWANFIQNYHLTLFSTALCDDDDYTPCATSPAAFCHNFAKFV